MTPKKLINLLFITIPITAVVLGVASIFVHNFLATSGSDLKSLESAAQVLTGQNSLLHQQIAQASSLTLLKDKAPSLGFLTPERVVYVNLSQPLAQR